LACAVVVGGFFGDEGKGKIISYLALKDKPSIAARGGVGPNAGHTVQYRGHTYGLRMIPSAFVYEKSRLLIGAGVAVNPTILLKEMRETGTEGRVGVDRNCPIIEERHVAQEAESEYLSKKIGSTKSGVGACHAERVLRMARLAADIQELSNYVTDVAGEVNDALDRGKNVLVEGTQGTFLSLYHGTYPYCTGKDVTASAICSDVGVGPTMVDEVIIVFKSYVTRVGGGPLEGEIPREEAEKRNWLEMATVTGRERRAAPFNTHLAKRAAKINGATQIAITKLDVLFPQMAGIRKYAKLSKPAKEFLEDITAEVGVPVTLIGTGPSAADIIDRRR